MAGPTPACEALTRFAENPWFCEVRAATAEARLLTANSRARVVVVLGQDEDTTCVRTLGRAP